MTRLNDTRCQSCVHYRLIAPYAPTPICAKTKNPKHQFCGHAWERCEGKYWEARK